MKRVVLIAGRWRCRVHMPPVLVFGTLVILGAAVRSLAAQGGTNTYPSIPQRPDDLPALLFPWSAPAVGVGGKFPEASVQITGCQTAGPLVTTINTLMDKEGWEAAGWRWGEDFRASIAREEQITIALENIETKEERVFVIDVDKPACVLKRFGCWRFLGLTGETHEGSMCEQDVRDTSAWMHREFASRDGVLTYQYETISSTGALRFFLSENDERNDGYILRGKIKQGMPDGRWIRQARDGAISLWVVRDGLLNGRGGHWTKDHAAVIEHKDGELCGLQCEWDGNGRLRSADSMIDGVRNGVSLEVDKGGIMKTQLYSGGVLLGEVFSEAIPRSCLPAEPVDLPRLER